MQQKYEHNAKIKAVVEEIGEAGRAGNSKKMFAAVKNLKRKSIKELTVMDDKKKVIVAPAEVYKTISNHYQNHFQKEDHVPVIRFPDVPTPLDNPVSAEEVEKALKGMTNSRAAYDNMAAELLKYAPSVIHEEISKALNELVEEQKDIDVGAGKIAPIEKPKKPMPGPAANLRPITLLKVIRKVLSKITLNRLRPTMEEYLSPSQCAYRNGRSTTDAIWSYRWMLAKVQKEDIVIYTTGIDMTAAFDTIDRTKLVQLIEEIADPDTARLVRILLSDTTLQVKLANYQMDTILFISNIGSPQGDSVSGPLFILYFEYALRKVRIALGSTPMVDDHRYADQEADEEFDYNNNNIDNPFLEHSYAESAPSTAPPSEIKYADDKDFITLQKEKHILYGKIVKDILGDEGLDVNESKTEIVELKRGDRDTELWREVVKLGSCLGDAEDIARRKQLALAAFQSMKKVWLDKQHVEFQKTLQLLDALVMSVLFYNCSCWGIRKVDLEMIESFQRNLLRNILNIRYPDHISNAKLYKLTKTKPARVRITKSRWQYFGHALRLPKDSPPQVAMSYFFHETSAKRFRGKRCTIVTTLQVDISKTRAKFPNFQVQSLNCFQDLIKLRQLASDRVGWRRITKSVLDTVEAECAKPVPQGPD